MNTNNNDELILCEDCGVEFNLSQFDDIAFEFNEAHPKCPVCQENASMINMQCKYCDLPVQYKADGLGLCKSHFEDYVENHPYLGD
jgi:predicted amidophosphoribosyltransferase